MLYLLALACAPSGGPPTVVARRGDLDVHVTFEGELEAVRSSQVFSRMEGWNELTQLAEEGSRVAEGDELFRLKVEHLEKEKVEIQADLEGAQTRVEQARARLAIKLGQARAKLLEAPLDAELAALRTTDSLTVPRVERERARIESDKARMTIESAGNEQQRLEMEAAAEIQILQLEAELQRARLREVEDQLGHGVVHAPHAGFVIVNERWDGKLKVGTEVPLDFAVITLPDLAELKVVGWVHEVDAPAVRVEQPATMHLDAQRDALLTGSITEVAQLAVPRGDHGEKHLRVELDLERTLPSMKPGMTVDVDLVVRTVREGVLLPSEAVFPGTSGPIVHLPDGSAIQVEVLADDGEQVAVKGVSPGDEVFVFDPRAWARGERPVEPLP